MLYYKYYFYVFRRQAYFEKSLMAFFGGGQSKSFLGVDIGASSVKVVELGVEKGRPRLLTYGYSERKELSGSVSPFDDVVNTGRLLARVCKEAGVKSTRAMTALPASGVFSTILTLPYRKEKKEMQTLVDIEAAKLTPLPLEQMVTYSTYLDDLGKKQESPKTSLALEKKMTHVLVTGAAKTLVQKYVEMFKVAKLDLQAIDTEAFALVRALIGKDRSATLVVDIGSKRTNLLLAERGIPFLSRSINIGGDTVTAQLQEQMQFSSEEAERMKRDLGSASLSGEKLPPLLEPFAQALLNEIRYAMQLFSGMDMIQQKRIEKVILTGGSSHLPGMAEALSNALNLNVYRGDPWARLSYPEPLRPVLDDIGPRMSVAIGLAMRDLDTP
jgi:type IV pilus assembly protein PilM